jgi:hypothetical protein
LSFEGDLILIQCICSLFRDENENPVRISEEGEVGITLPLIQVQDTLIEQRSNAVKAIEQTITELQGIFQHLALLVHEQDLQIRR